MIDIEQYLINKKKTQKPFILKATLAVPFKKMYSLLLVKFYFMQIMEIEILIIHYERSKGAKILLQMSFTWLFLTHICTHSNTECKLLRLL